MSNLLSQASLVMIPSGYKEDVVYSQIPTSGAGDLSFTRASNGTRINSAGLVEVCPWNLVQQSETFDNAYWSKDNSTITANSTTAPNGTTTADTFTKTSGSTAYLYNGSFNLGIGQFTQSIYAKANASSSIRLEFVTSAFGNGAACIFDLSNGTAGSITIYGGVSGFTATIENVGNGWYRCSLGGTITIADTYYYEISITTGSIYIWGAQLNIGSTAKPYFPTTDRLNVPRLTYQNGGGGCPSLLLEKQSTNLMLYSEQFDNAVYTKRNSTISANATISPDGTTNADKIQEDTSINRHDIYQDFICTNGVTYTQTIFAKQGERRYCFMSFGTALINAGDTFFDLQDGVVVSTPSGITSAIQNMGNGWFRCSITATCSSGGTGYYVNGPAITSSNYIYQGVSGYGIYVWGCQIEASSYPTSLIQTTSSSATRVADACFKTGISSLIGQNEGVMFIDCVLNGTSTGGASNYGNILNTNRTANTTAAIAFLYVESTSTLTVNYFNGNGSYTPIVTLDKGSINMGDRVKIAFAYKSGDFALYVNGSLAATSTTTFTPAGGMDDIYLSDLNIYYGYPMGLKVNEQLFSKTRLTNAELASLTTI